MVERSPGVADHGEAGARRVALDNLKVFLVAGVIVAHVLMAYSDIGSWAYSEPTDNPAFAIPAALGVSLGTMFAMGLFFLIAGLLTPPSLARKGTSRFLRDRLLRFGVPLAVYVLVVYPLVSWAGASSRQQFVDYVKDWDPGPLWFVGVLLLFSLGYLAWRRRRPTPRAPTRTLGWLLVTAAGVVAVGSFVVRLRFPMNSSQLLAAHVWQWPQCLTLFALGTIAAERRWLDPVPARIGRFGGRAALIGAIVLVGAFAIDHEDVDPYSGGVTWQAGVTAVAEGLISIGFAMWLLHLFQARFDHAGKFGLGLGRAAFGAYVLQAPVVVALALALRELSLAPEYKFLIVAPLALVSSFGLAWLLTLLPGVRRVL
jgi:glucans biosynthesis protein C